MSGTTEPVTGRCLCGRVSYRIDGPVGDVYGCHCSQCRRQSGNYMAGASVAWSDVKLDGAEHLTWYRSSDFAQRGFCDTCGSHLFWRADDGQAAIEAGSVDEPTGLRLVGHIFAADKGDFYEITDGLPQYDAGAPDD